VLGAGHVQIADFMRVLHLPNVAWIARSRGYLSLLNEYLALPCDYPKNADTQNKTGTVEFIYSRQRIRFCNPSLKNTEAHRQNNGRRETDNVSQALSAG